MMFLVVFLKERKKGGGVFHALFAPLHQLPLTHPVVHGHAVTGFCCIPRVVSGLFVFFPLSSSYFLLFVYFLFFKFLFHSPTQFTVTNLCLCREKGMGEGVSRVIRNTTCRSHQLWQTAKRSPQAKHRRDCGRTGYVLWLVCLPYTTVKTAGVSATCEADSSAQYHAVRACTEVHDQSRKWTVCFFVLVYWMHFTL